MEKQRIADEVGGWMSELDACDGYVVLLGHPTQDAPLHALGPYTGREALHAADLHDRGGAVDVRVVRLYRRPPASSPSATTPCRPGS